jgi:hypothetical protein
VTDRDVDVAEQRAREFVLFCDGMEEAGFETFARRGRVVCDDVSRLADELRTERSARVSIQEQRDQAVKLLANRAAAGAAG